MVISDLAENGTALVKTEKCKDHKPNQFITSTEATISEGRIDPSPSCHKILAHSFGAHRDVLYIVQCTIQILIQ